jgi:hypothetical protein
MQNYTKRLGFSRSSAGRASGLAVSISMPFLVCRRRAVVLVALALVAALSDAALAQRTSRTLAPGVLTTIPPAPHAEELFSGPQPLVEIPAVMKNSKYEPKLSSPSSTVYEKSQQVLMRRTIWNLELSFKPMRMIYVDVPQSSGRMQRQLLWYMVYRVRNPGHHLKPKGLIKPDSLAASGETIDPNEELLKLIDPSVPEAKELYEKFKDATDEVEVFGRKTTELRFFPHFVLHSTEYKKEYLDQVIPAALGPIKAREFPGREDTPVYNSLNISEVPLPVSHDANDGVWGVVTWAHIDPRIDYFVVHIQGLTNAYKFEDPAGAFKAGDAPGTGRKLLKKTLQLNFWRPGDTVDPKEEEIHFGCRLDPDPADQQAILKEYGIEKPVDYVWVYR